MKHLIIITITLIFWGCNSNNSETNNKNQTGTTTTTIDTDKIEYIGKWILEDYLDNIIKNKSISKYRMIRPSWFAIMIDITDNSIKTYGSISKQADTLIAKNDTLLVFKHFTTNKGWLITYNKDNSRIEIINTDSLTEKYLYRRLNNDEKEILIFEETNYFPLKTGINEFFKEKLFVRTYIDLTNNDTINFLQNRNISDDFKLSKQSFKLKLLDK